MPEMILRHGWTDRANGRANRSLVLGNVVGITWHYPGQSGHMTGMSAPQVAAQLRAWQAQHIRQQWRDIGYNFLIDGSGRIWEGCGLFQGAHAGSTTGNATTVGVQLIVGIGEEPTAAQIEAARWFRAWLLGRAPRAGAAWPHSHWTSTACPGDQVRRLVASGSLTTPPVQSAAATTGGLTMSDVNTILAWIHTSAEETRAARRDLATVHESVLRVEAKENAIVEALKGVKGVDPEQIERLVREGIAGALASIDTTVTLKPLELPAEVALAISEGQAKA